MTWDSAADARLRELWGTDASAAEIGREMGLTKNAVVGRAHRMRLPARPSPILAAPVAPNDWQQRRMRDLVARGHTRLQIADLMGQKLPLIHHWARLLGMARVRRVEMHSAAAVDRARSITETLRAEASFRLAQQGGRAEPGLVAQHLPAPAGSPVRPGHAEAPAGCGGLDVSSLNLPPAVATRPAVFSGLRGGCRWPLWADDGKPDGRFCGAARVRGAYCAAHGARAYVRRPLQLMPATAALGGWR